MRVTITVSDTLDLPLETVWQKLKTFDKFADFYPAAIRSFYLQQTEAGYGSIRRIEMVDGYVEELLVDIDEQSHLLEYIILNSTLPIEGYRAIIKLYPITQTHGTFIQWRADFSTSHPAAETFADEVKKQVFIAAIDGLKQHLSANA